MPCAYWNICSLPQFAPAPAFGAPAAGGFQCFGAGAPATAPFGAPAATSPFGVGPASSPFGAPAAAAAGFGLGVGGATGTGNPPYQAVVEREQGATPGQVREVQRNVYAALDLVTIIHEHGTVHCRHSKRSNTKLSLRCHRTRTSHSRCVSSCVSGPSFACRNVILSRPSAVSS